MGMFALHKCRAISSLNYLKSYVYKSSSYFRVVWLSLYLVSHSQNLKLLVSGIPNCGLPHILDMDKVVQITQ